MKRVYHTLAVIILLGLLVSCGGSGPFGGGGPQFTIASGNWSVPLFNAGTQVGLAGGELSQNGSTISGVFHISRSSCFDPVADTLMVQGKVSGGGANPLTLTSSPVRGQTLTISATWDNSLNPGIPPPTSPPNPVRNLVGNWQISGGNCAGSGSGSFMLIDFTNTWTGHISGSGWGGNFTAVLTQTPPNAQGFSQFSGTITVTGSPCFTSGTITSANFAGDSAAVTFVMNSGQMTGTAGIGRRLLAGATFEEIVFNLMVQGGSCDGQTVNAGGPQ